MSTLPPRGFRLLPTLVDYYATNKVPRQPWAAIPIDSNDLSKGFKDVTYSQLSNAVNHAALWLSRELPTATTEFETIAYVGPKDLRYPILALAVAKLGRRILLPSPFTAPAALAHLARLSEVKIFLYGGPLGPLIQSVLSQESDPKPITLQLPELFKWLSDEVATHVPFTKSWDEAKDDPWMIFHTSGTTGLPKLVTYTHLMMTSLEISDLLPDSRTNKLEEHIEKLRIYTPLPSLHVMGMFTVLQLTIYLNNTFVADPISSGPPNLPSILETLHHGRVDTALLPPSLIDALCSTPAGLAALRKLKTVYFGGAGLSAKSAALLVPHTNAMPAFGSTEQCMYFTRHHADGEDWEYISFHECMGLEFRPVSDGMYELVFVKKEGLERYQQVFRVYPELQEFPTKDLFTPHPTKPDRWKYVGRTDDMIVFSHGHNLHVMGIEEAIAQHTGVAAVLVGGQGRTKPFVLVEWRHGVAKEEKTVEAIWPTVEKVNEGIVSLVRLQRGMMVVLGSEKKLVRTGKGTVARRDSEVAFRDEIDVLYD